MSAAEKLDPEPADDGSSLVKQWTPLVYLIASQYLSQLGRWYELSDLVGEGQMVIWQCSTLWDPSAGASFKTYAYHSLVHRYEYLKKSWRSHKRRGSKYAESIEADREREWRRLPDLLAQDPMPEQALMSGEGCWLVQQALAALKPAQRRVLEGRFAEELSLKQVGETLGLTRERARQIEKIALGKLRKSLIAAYPDLSGAPPPTSGVGARSLTDEEAAHRRRYRSQRKVATEPQVT
jgi:RNA polymerase sigma factor (sigma-70 family)